MGHHLLLNIFHCILKIYTFWYSNWGMYKENFHSEQDSVSVALPGYFAFFNFIYQLDTLSSMFRFVPVLYLIFFQ